jgi:GMP synthase (glutamine-hydrolysing)
VNSYAWGALARAMWMVPSSGRAPALRRPALGICLGGQLLAQTFGGTVTTGDRGLEAGIVRIRWRSEAQGDALLANLPMPFLAGAMHDDTVKTLPEIAVWLGHSDMYPHQAFRVGPYAWGVQFHPEVSLAGYREWVAERGATDPVALRRMRRGAADFQRLDENVIVGISVLARRFADLVRAFSWRAPRRSIRVGDAVPEA